MKYGRSIIIGVLILAAGILVMKWFRSQKVEIKQINAELVSVVEIAEAQNGQVRLTVPVTGKLKAQQRIDLFAEVSGILHPGAKPFKEGTAFGAGELLLNIDDREARNNLMAQKSQLLNQVTLLLPDLKLDYPAAYPKWENWLKAFRVDAPIPDLPEITDDKTRYFISSRNILNQFYTIRSAEVRLGKFKVSAPFSGTLVNTMIDAGALVRGGQKLGEFINPSGYEMEAAISISDADLLAIGDTVRLSSTELPGKWTGTVSRISNQLDATTQSIKVYIAVAGDRLREGMFMEGRAIAESIDNVVSIPRSLITSSNKVYAVDGELLKTHDVSVVQYSRDSAIVRGIPDNTKVVTTSIAGAYEGMKVIIRTSKS